MSIKDEIAAINRNTARIRTIRQDIEAMRSETWTVTLDDVLALDNCELRIPTIRLELEAYPRWREIAGVRHSAPDPLVSLNAAERKVWEAGRWDAYHFEPIEPDDSWLFKALARWVDLNAATLYAAKLEADAAERDLMASYRYYLED